MNDPAHQQVPGQSSVPPEVRPPLDPSGAMPPPPPPPPRSQPLPPPPFPPYDGQRGGRRGGRIIGWSLTGILVSVLMISVAFNIYLFLFFSSVTSGPREASYARGHDSGRIVILPVQHLIDEATYRYVRQSLVKLRRDPPNAVILRVESGGGYVGPSDRIFNEIQRFKKETGLPVVASFGTLAASGAYYISVGCDWIVAEPTCVTGSIGVMSTAFTVDRLLDKLGVSPEVQSSTDAPNKDVANNMFRPWQERDRQQQQLGLDRAHARFVDVVFEGRQAQLGTHERAAEVANGKIYSTQEAIDLQLIDEEGYVDAAIDKAKQLAGIESSAKPRITIMRKPVKLGLSGLLGSRMRASDQIDAEYIRRLLVELSTPRLECRYP